MDPQEYTEKGTFATLPRTTRGLPLVLGDDPKGKNFLYCNGNSVIIRDIRNPEICDIYTQHSTLTTVAKYSPSGFYISSGDQLGKIRIWDTTQKEHILKHEFQPLSGAIKDIAWSADSQRIAVVGEGRERFGHVFLADTGTSNGNLSGQSKTMNSVDFRPTRPFRIVSASEDNTVAIFEGPPFKFKNYHQCHTRFAQCARYQPSGGLFASAGADGRVFLFQGEDGEPLGELQGEGGVAHGGGIYALAWSPDGSQLLTASGDKTCKIWDVETKTMRTKFVFGSAVECQQLGCLWQGEFLLSVSLSGFIHYLDPNDPSKPIRILKGHNKPITSVVTSSDKAQMFTGDMEGNITRWISETGETERVEPKVHKAQVQAMGIGADALFSVSMDDTLACTTGVIQNPSNARSESVKLNSQPRGLVVSGDGDLSLVACQKEICVFRRGRQTASLPLPYEPLCVAVNPQKNTVAVGGEDSKVHVYALGPGDSLTAGRELSHTGAVTAASWNGDGSVCAVTDAGRRVVPYRTPEWATAAGKEWAFHTAKVNCVAWAPDGRRLATGSLDTNIIVWDLHKSGDHPIIIRGAHTMSQITGLCWLGPNRLVSVGQDSNVKQWLLHF